MIRLVCVSGGVYRMWVGDGRVGVRARQLDFSFWPRGYYQQVFFCMSSYVHGVHLLIDWFCWNAHAVPLELYPAHGIWLHCNNGGVQAVVQFLVNEVKEEKLGESLNEQLNRWAAVILCISKHHAIWALHTKPFCLLLLFSVIFTVQTSVHNPRPCSLRVLCGWVCRLLLETCNSWCSLLCPAILHTCSSVFSCFCTGLLQAYLAVRQLLCCLNVCRQDMFAELLTESEDASRRRSVCQQRFTSLTRAMAVLQQAPSMYAQNLQKRGP